MTMLSIFCGLGRPFCSISVPVKYLKDVDPSLALRPYIDWVSGSSYPIESFMCGRIPDISGSRSGICA